MENIMKLPVFVVYLAKVCTFETIKYVIISDMRVTWNQVFFGSFEVVFQQ